MPDLIDKLFSLMHKQEYGFRFIWRKCSYAQAASELCLTHDAVSRQIGAFEAWLGQKLFVKSGRRMVATPIATLFAADVSLAFDRVTIAAKLAGDPARAGFCGSAR